MVRERLAIISVLAIHSPVFHHKKNIDAFAHRTKIIQRTNHFGRHDNHVQYDISNGLWLVIQIREGILQRLDLMRHDRRVKLTIDVRSFVFGLLILAIMNGVYSAIKPCVFTLSGSDNGSANRVCDAFILKFSASSVQNHFSLLLS